MSSIVDQRPLRICYFGTYREGYTRNQIVLKGLLAQPDVEVIVCHATLWHGIEDRVDQASGGWANPRFWWRVARAYRQLMRQYRQMPDYDVMLIGYPGQLDTFLARALTRGRRPVALDILMSLHLVAEERGLTVANPTSGHLLFQMERAGLRQPDLLIAENQGYQDYISQKYDLPPDRFCLVPHGADENVFYPRPVDPPQHEFRVTYHGGYLPSHGLDTIIDAAGQLHHANEIHFHFYGNGPEKERIMVQAQDAGLGNVTFHGFVSRDELLDGIAQSNVCLGVFGSTRQSLFTVQNKVWESLAMARPLISGDSPTVREFLADGEEVILIPRHDSEALAAAILQLRSDPERCEALALAGYQRYITNNSTVAIGRQMKEALLGLVDGTFR